MCMQYTDHRLQMNEQHDIKIAGPETVYEKKSYKPLLHDILFNIPLVEREKATDQLGAEADLIVIPGSETSRQYTHAPILSTAR